MTAHPMKGMGRIHPRGAIPLKLGMSLRKAMATLQAPHPPRLSPTRRLRSLKCISKLPMAALPSWVKKRDAKRELLWRSSRFLSQNFRIQRCVQPLRCAEKPHYSRMGTGAVTSTWLGATAHS